MIEFSTDNLPYEKVGKNEPVCIADAIPFDVPDSWEWVRLGHVCEIARGGSPRPIKAFLTEDPNGINWIKIGDTDKGGKYINSTKERIIPEGVSKSRMVHAGDFLLTNSMSFGRPYILNVDGCIHDGWLVLSEYNRAYDQDFLFHMLSSRFAYFQFCDVVSGAVVKNLNSDKVAAALFPLPPLSEQKRIVEAIESVIPSVNEYDAAESLLRNLNSTFPDRLKKSILQWAIQGKLVPQDPMDEPAEVLLARIREEKKRLIKEGKIKKDKHESIIFRRDNSHYEKVGLEETCIDNELPFDIPDTWSWVRFSDIAIFENGDRSNKYPVEADYVSDGIPFFGAKDMGDKYMEFSTVRFITQEKFAQLGNGKLQNGDLVCLLRGSVGKTRIFKESEKYSTGFICAQMMIIRCLDLNILDYLYALINSPYYCKATESKITGTAVRQLPAREVANILIPLPPLNEQFRIIEKLSEIFFDLQTL